MESFQAGNVDFILAAHDCLAFGGGAGSGSGSGSGSGGGLSGVGGTAAEDTGAPPQSGAHAWAQFGLWLDSDLHKGSSAPCLTFGNEGLLSHQQDFEVAAVEVWGFA